MATATETFTELLRHPKDVVARTENGAVRITRRDADDLMRNTPADGMVTGIGTVKNSLGQAEGGSADSERMLILMDIEALMSSADMGLMESSLH